MEPDPVARADPAGELVPALCLLELTGAHGPAPPVAVARSPVASSTPSGCCRQTVHEVLCPCACVGHAAESANVVVHLRRVSANVDMAPSSRGDCCAVLTQNRTGPFQLRPGCGRVAQYRAHDLSVHRAVVFDHPLSWLAVGVVSL